MRTTGCCPKCSERDIVHVRHVADSSSATAHQTGSEAPTAARLALRIERQKALLGGSFDAAVTEGRLEAYVCRSCGYVEQYLVDPSELTVDGEHIRQHQVATPVYR